MSSLASQPSLLAQFQASEKPCFIKLVGGTWRTRKIVLWAPHVQPHRTWPWGQGLYKTLPWASEAAQGNHAWWNEFNTWDLHRRNPTPVNCPLTSIYRPTHNTQSKILKREGGRQLSGVKHLPSSMRIKVWWSEPTWLENQLTGIDTYTQNEF